MYFLCILYVCLVKNLKVMFKLNTKFISYVLSYSELQRKFVPNKLQQYCKKLKTSCKVNKIKLKATEYIYKSEDQNPNKQMAKSRYEYVKNYERDENLLPNTWIVIRVDGRGFHKFSQAHDFKKPNDERALNLMNCAGISVMQEFKDIVIAYGQSDEYSFVFKKDTKLYNRRLQKLMSYVNSLFTSSYVMHWNEYFNDVELKYPPFFDARIILYPADYNLKDYLSWRQADVHVNNLYNTAFWNLIQKGGLTNREAEQKLSGTFSADKNEILFSQFGINYNNEPAIFRKGTTLMRKMIKNPLKGNEKLSQVVFPIHRDLIKEKFWKEHDEILSGKSPKPYDWLVDYKLLPTLVLKQINNKDDVTTDIVDTDG